MVLLYTNKSNKQKSLRTVRSAENFDGTYVLYKYHTHMSEINKKAFRNCKKGQFYNIPSKKTDVASKPRYKFPFFQPVRETRKYKKEI